MYQLGCMLTVIRDMAPTTRVLDDTEKVVRPAGELASMMGFATIDWGALLIAHSAFAQTAVYAAVAVHRSKQ